MTVQNKIYEFILKNYKVRQKAKVISLFFALELLFWDALSKYDKLASRAVGTSCLNSKVNNLFIAANPSVFEYYYFQKQKEGDAGILDNVSLFKFFSLIS